MRTFGPAVKVGLTFLAVLAGAYWAFMMVAKGSCAGKAEEFRVHAFFQDATLLVEKSRVQIAGLNVGHIVSRELNVRPPRPQLIRQKRFAKITVTLNKDVTLYTNAVIYKRSASLLGDFYLEIDPGTYEWVDEEGKKHVGETIKNGDEIKRVGEAATAPGVIQQVSDILPVLKALMKDIRKFTKGPLLTIGKNINEGISENRQSIKSIVDNMEKITRDIRGVTGSANEDVRKILADISAITGAVRTLVADGKAGDDIKQGVNKLNSAVDKLDRALSNTATITDDIKDVTGDLREGKGTVGRLLKDETLIDSIEDAVSDVGGLVKSITMLQTVVGLRSEYNFQAGTIKTYVHIELRPRPDKFYFIELINDPRGRRDVTTTITRSDDPSKPLVTREDKVVLSDAFRVSFMFAKRIKFATFRFGIKESTGGIGVDLKFFNDRLQLWSDLFDFQANLYPRLKLLAAWEFFRRMWVVGGVDDVFNPRPQDGVGGGRDYFVGAMLRFNDQDLRNLLLLGGASVAASGG